MATLPAFRTLEDVPRHGISLGLGTIAEARSSAMILTGADKKTALRQVSEAAGYDPAWPATIAVEMPDVVLLVDRARPPISRDLFSVL